MNTVKVALFKSLSIIMGIQIGGWLFSLTAYNLVDKGYLNNLSEDKQTLICTAINCFSSLTSTCEVPAIFISRCFLIINICKCQGDLSIQNLIIINFWSIFKIIGNKI